MQKGGLNFLPGDADYCQSWEVGNALIIGKIGPGSNRGGTYDVSVSYALAGETGCLCAQDNGGKWCHCANSTTIATMVPNKRDALVIAFDAARAKGDG
jgi:hypothetical protein